VSCVEHRIRQLTSTLEVPLDTELRRLEICSD
jgi:hypothetical protein